MPVDINEYVDVDSRARKLLCNTPTSLALLPANFATAKSKRQLYYDNHARVLRNRMASSGLTETPLEKNGDIFKNPIQEGEPGHVVLGLFVGTEFFKDNALAPITLADLIIGTLEEIGKRSPGFRKVTLEVAVQRPQPRSYGLIKYVGNPIGLQDYDLKRAVQQLSTGVA